MLLLAMIVICILLSVAVWFSFPCFVQDVKESIRLLFLFSKVKVIKDQLNPLNEGKLVLVSGELEMISPAIDKETDREFGFPVVRRIDETYTAIKEKTSGSYTCVWGISADRTFTGRAFIGDIEIDKDLLCHIPCHRHIEMMYGKQQHVLTRTNYCTYTHDNITMIGIQKEGKLIADKRFVDQDVEFGIHNASVFRRKRCSVYANNILLSCLEIIELIVVIIILFIL